ncbi:MAG: 3D-(3,5/4)-trihydroxycyclohexane-1,2-dione acylhydrolase (decyclizing) [Actinomycetales bacterium]|nr:3D-(3,5/4)-trihydroxycyclohexane-1,2-dione acylhydrolase (decyclizing) [Actinomycetales bacterium]
MSTVQITTAEALVRFLVAQRIDAEGTTEQLFPAVIGIFGHGNVTSLGHSLEQHRDEIPLWRGQNEQGMGLAAAAYAKAKQRRQILIATSSIGPGATNMVTAAGVAMSNRLPVLFISGDTFTSRLPDPVLQQVEHFGNPTITVNDAFKPVVRYWDRITHPAQLLTSLPQMVSTLLDPADCGPAFIGLPQDIAAMAYDFPESFFDPILHHIPRYGADAQQISHAIELIKNAKRPVIIAGGGVHYSRAEAQLSEFAHSHGIPVVETVAGKSSLVASESMYVGAVGVTGANPANELIRQSDLVIAIGTRLEDFTTGSWTLIPETTPILAINAARFDAIKHAAVGVVGDAQLCMQTISAGLGGYTSDARWLETASGLRQDFFDFVTSRVTPDGVWPPSYAQIIGKVHDQATEADYVLTASGGLPGELNINWASRSIRSFDCEYGFSCMGYEISGAWGAAMAHAESPKATQGDVFAFVGDGSYLMLNSDIYSSVLSGKKFILLVCDNKGFAVIERLQVGQGGNSYNNMLRDSTGPGHEVRVDFAANARSLGAQTISVASMEELEAALAVARKAITTVAIVLDVRESDWTEGGAFWQVGVPEVSNLDSVNQAREAMNQGLASQRRGR